MKKLFYIIAIVGTLQSVFGQQELKRADNYFNRAFYNDAITLYQELLPRNKSPKLIKNLADSYYNTYDMKSAARWYSYLISNYGNNIDGTYYFKLNQALKATGKYNEATKVLMDYYAQQNDTSLVIQLKQELNYLENISAIGNRFTIENLNINTVNSEFGAMQVDSNLVYSASKKTGSINKLYRWNNQNYLDIYTHPVNKLNVGDSLSKGISKAINTKMHEGTFAIAKDRKTIYFTRNNFIKNKKKRDDNKVTNLKIYKAEWIDETWKNITELPFNSNDYSTEHPALNNEETKLYFSSDRPGGLGSFDIYSVTIKPNNLFGSPVNMGKTINTNKKEQFPFLDKSNTLYFSSNGLPGYGLLDVFVSKNVNGVYEKPDNIGKPVNSGHDDFSFTLNNDEKTGYFSSNRPTGKGSDDIYAFTETNPLIIEDCKQSVFGILTDKTTKEPIANGTVHLLDSDKNGIATVVTKENGSFNFNVECSVAYTIKASKTGYENNSKTIITTKERNKAHDGSLELFSILEKEKELLLAEQKKQEQQLRKEKEIKEKTKRERSQNILNTIKKENAIVKEKERTVIKTEPILFDYSLWYLRKISRDRLNTVIKIMKTNPKMVVEIGTHTDSRGNKGYNQMLSQKRANSVKAYFLEQGIADERIIPIGYGESKPIIVCRTDESCTEEDHEINRRSEFVIVKWE